MTIKKTILLSGLLAAIAPVTGFAAAPAESATRAWAAQLGPNAKTFYQDVFALIEAQQWAAASAKLDSIPEGPLHNVARAQLYLAKGSPKVEGMMLATLAEKAPDLPQARALVALAKSRGVEALPALPSAQELGWLGSSPRRSRVAGSEVRGLALAGTINPLLKDDRPNDAEDALNKAKDGLDAESLTQWQHRIAWSYYLTGDDGAARRLAAVAAAGSGDFAPQAEWVAGLAAWRQKDFAEASTRFSSVARRSSDIEMAAAGHYWAARADMAGGHPERIDARLKAAARNAETFYGLIALQQLGLKARPVDQAALGGIEKKPNVRAALALSEIGKLDLADELIRWQARIGDARDHAELATIAGRMDLPSTQLWLAHNGPSGARAAVSARYPAPQNWRPTGGWRVERELVYAHTLQESQFRTNVTSPAGARGLMQVRPGTAGDIARSRGTGLGTLSDPATNLEYGQSYIESIRDRGETGGMLLKVIAAYNAGPAPVGEWNARARDNGDPLLYMESIPYWETRAYVATVLRNYWMYKLQDGKPAPSLAALSQGMWPRFPGLPGATAVRMTASGGVRSAE